MTDRIIAIDPGTTQSALVEWDGKIIQNAQIAENIQIRGWLRDPPDVGWIINKRHSVVIEQVAAMGMPVGESVFETVYWSGIFAEAAGLERVYRIKRHVVKNHLCGSSRAKDSNIRQALIDRFGAPGTKKAPAPTYGLKADLWQAFALAVTWWDQNVKLEGKVMPMIAG